MDMPNLAFLGEKATPKFIPLYGVLEDGACQCREGKGCKNPGKHPCIGAWQNSGTDDPAVLEDWRKRWPGLNLGIVTGEPSGFFVLDVDPDHGGIDSLKEWKEQGLDLGAPPLFRTGGGGFHVLFALPPDFIPTTTAGKLAPGLDIRGAGGQIVAPGSLHRSGKRYKVEVKAPLAPAPEWLLDRLRKLAGKAPTPGPAAATPCAGEPPPAGRQAIAKARAALERHGPPPEGTGGGQHAVQAGMILCRDFALSEDEALPLMREWSARYWPGKDDEELLYRLRNGRKYGRNEPGSKRPAETGSLEKATALIDAFEREGSQDEAAALALVAEVAALPWDVTEKPGRAMIQRRLRVVTGIPQNQLGLAKPRDLKAEAERAERREAYSKGAAEFLDPRAHLDVARAFLNAHMDEEGEPGLVRWRGDFLREELGSPCYEVTDDEAVFADLFPWLADGKIHVDTGAPIRPDSSTAEGCLKALKAAAAVSGDIPRWRSPRPDDPPPGGLIVFPNGILDPTTRDFRRPTRRYLTVNAVDYDYNPAAPRPENWLYLLKSQWSDDPESIQVVQEYYGYLLTQETKYHVALVPQGAPRSGKGIMLRTASALVGRANTCAPSLRDLGERFGLEQFINKSLAIIPEVKEGTNLNKGQIAETLLKITGEDTMSIDRKNRQAWTGKLKTRLIISSNQVLTFHDPSGAMLTRLIVLDMKHSFAGRENRGLEERIMGELPGICNWALEGLDRLTARGAFVQPASGRAALGVFRDLACPHKEFLEDCCILAPELKTRRKALFEAYLQWSREQNRRTDNVSQAVFGRDLRSAVRGLGDTKIREGNSIVRYYTGIGLKESVEGAF